MDKGHFPMPICEQIWNQKYRFKTEREGIKSDANVVDTWGRIAEACADVPRLHNNNEERKALEQRFYSGLYDFKFLPAGRINSGAGTGRGSASSRLGAAELFPKCKASAGAHHSEGG